MALDLTAGRRGLAALGTVIAQWVEHLLAVEVAVEPLIEAQNVNLTWYVGLDAQGTAIGDALWNGEDLDEGVRDRIVGLYRLMLGRSRHSAGQGPGRAHLSAAGHDGGRHGSHETAEPPDRLADPAIGDGIVSSALAAHPGWRRGGAAQGAIALDRFHLEADIGAGRTAGGRALDGFVGRGRRLRRSMPARPKSNCIAPRRRTTATIWRATAELWVSLRPTGIDPPYEVFGVTADPAEGEAWTEAGGDLVDVVAMPEPIRAVIDSVRRRASRRAAVLQAQARSCGPRSVGTPRSDRARSETSERAGQLSGALGAAQARGGESRRAVRAELRRCNPTPPGIAGAPRKSGAELRGEILQVPRDGEAAAAVFDLTQVAVDRFDHGRRPTSALSCRPVFRPNCPVRPFAARGVADPAIREFVGLADYDWDFKHRGAITGFGPLEMTEELRRRVTEMVGRSLPRTAGRTKPTAARPDRGWC